MLDIALEATTGSVANPVSDALAEKAIALLFQYLPLAYRDGPARSHALGQVMRASTLAGMAFGNADVAGVHCLSESLGALYDTPHGLANAVLLRAVLASHRPHIDSRLSELAALLSAGRVADADGFMASLEALAIELDIPSFAALNVPRSDFERLAKMAVANGSNSSNPRPMDDKAYLEILNGLL